MPTARKPAVPSIERFFQFSLLGLVTSAFCALADTGRLDGPSLAFLLGGVALRGLMVLGVIRLNMPRKWITLVATAYLLFYPVDYYLISRDFFAATAHGVCFLGVARILSAQSNRDYLYTGSLSFVALIGAAALSTELRFFLWLALAILFGLAVMTSSEIRRGFQRNNRAVATAAARTRLRTGWTLAITVGCAACGILALTAGLFLILPRTARAAAVLFPQGPRLTGFANSVDLGHFGAITKDDRPILHIRAYGANLPPDLKWRGSALSVFNGQQWTEPPLHPDVIQALGRVTVADNRQLSRRDHERMLYRVDVSNSDNGTLFIAGVPEYINLGFSASEIPTLMRTAESSYRAIPGPGEPLVYEVSAEPGDPLPLLLTNADRARNLRLPSRLDKRIAALGREWSGLEDSTDFDRAAKIEAHLHHGFTYSLDTGDRPARDPLADFLFVTKRGYCEYFASAMAVLLRTQKIPARVATGFQSGYYNDVSGTWVMRASDAHAWVEAWIDGRGWVTFDPTPPASDTAANGWLQLKLRRVAMYLDAIDTMWQRWVMSYGPGQQITLAIGFRNKLLSLGGNGASLKWPESVGSTARFWTIFGLALAAIVIFARFLAPHLRRGWSRGKSLRRIRAGGATPHDASLLYQQMLDSLARRGFQKPAWFTPAEFARNLPPAERESVSEFTAAYNELRFGGDSAGAERLTRILKTIETVRTTG